MSIQYPSGTPSEGDTFVHENETYTYYHGKWAKQYTYSGGSGNVDSITSNTSAITVDSSDPTNPVLDVGWGTTSDTVPRGNHSHSAYAPTSHQHSNYAPYSHQHETYVTQDYVDQTFVELEQRVKVLDGDPSSQSVGDMWFNKNTNTLLMRVV